MYLEAIEHLTDSNYAHAIDENTVVIRLRAKKGDLKKCILFYGDRACPVEPVITDSLEMTCIASDRLFDYFEVEFKCIYTRICYYFYLSDGCTWMYYYETGFQEKMECHRTELFQLAYIRREDIAAVPSWVNEAIIYQIFPDSFATSRRFISKEPNCLENHKGEKSLSLNGGTLAGIMENLDYLANLGINCLYLNPIFTAREYHKYDTTDYYTVDPCFGDNETLKELVKKSHEKGIKIILDGVFNHSGATFFAFKDVLEKGENSRYKDWFYRLEFPIKYCDTPNYECFAYEKHMPKLNTGNPEVIQYFIDVATYWIKEADIDGWRLDVANEINHDFWRLFRKAVKAAKPDAFLIAEIWEDSQTWLLGDQFDSTMNYRFANVCKGYFAKRRISVDDFDARASSLLLRYKKNITYAQMNLLDSHDIPRFLYESKGDIRRLKLAALFQMMFVGIPSICYGDEKGLTSTDKWDDRWPMIWDDNEISLELYSYYKKIISIRKRYMPLMLGDYKPLIKDPCSNVYAFIRQRDAEKMIVLLNNSDYVRKVNVPLGDNCGDRIFDVLNDQEYRISGPELGIEIAPMSGAVLTFD